MASKTTLNATNLEALGAATLAELLIEISEGNANAKRRLRLELAGVESPAKLGNEIRKRLNTIGAATTNVGWRTLKGFRADLNTQRRLIAEQVAVASPDEALDLMWQFIALGDVVIERTSDASGGVIEVFREASLDIGRILATAKVDTETLLPKIVDAVIANTYSQNDRLIENLAPAMDAEALKQLRPLLAAAASAPVSAAARARPVKRWRKRVLAASEALRKRPRAESVRLALQAIADALGDIDAFIALEKDANLPATATGIAERLLKAGRAEDALRILDTVRETRLAPIPPEWATARLAALEALGRKDEAQTFRLQRFSQRLSADDLRAYLKRLPDFDDIEAEDLALDQAMTYPDANATLAFLIAWPALERAAATVIHRVTELDGSDTEAVVFAADRLYAKYPLATLLLHRHIVEADLLAAQVKRQEAAAIHYLEAEGLAKYIEDFAGRGDHEAWQKRLRQTYPHRTTFWNALP